MSDPHTRRLLVHLICTLNASFPDYDFSTLKPENFTHEPHLGMACVATRGDRGPS